MSNQKTMGAFALAMSLSLSMALVAQAEDMAPMDTGTNSIEKENRPTTPPSESIDEVLTNNNLRAYSGSKSKWSFASQWNYLGGTINSPLSEDRPNIANSSATTVKSDLDGSLNVKYNINTANSVLVGFGVRWIAPLAASGPSNYTGTRLDAVNPTLTYQHVYKFGGIQSVLQVQALQYTQADTVAQGYAQQIQVDQENIYEIGTTGLSVGGSIGTGYNIFNIRRASLDSSQSVYQYWFAPYVEYKLSEKVNLRTVSNLLLFEYYRNGQSIHDTVTQSIGVGFSLSRDFFLYPNVQFLPGNILSDFTNVGLAATINLF